MLVMRTVFAGRSRRRTGHPRAFRGGVALKLSLYGLSPCHQLTSNKTYPGVREPFGLKKGGSNDGVGLLEENVLSSSSSEPTLSNNSDGEDLLACLPGAMPGHLQCDGTGFWGRGSGLCSLALSPSMNL